MDCYAAAGPAGAYSLVGSTSNHCCSPSSRVISSVCGFDDESNADFFSSHCNTCKELSGSTYTLNQIIPTKALKITKGDDLGKYTYKGDSGTFTHNIYPSYPY